MYWTNIMRSYLWQKICSLVVYHFFYMLTIDFFGKDKHEYQSKSDVSLSCYVWSKYIYFRLPYWTSKYYQPSQIIRPIIYFEIYYGSKFKPHPVWVWGIKLSFLNLFTTNVVKKKQKKPSMHCNENVYFIERMTRFQHFCNLVFDFCMLFYEITHFVSPWVVICCPCLEYRSINYTRVFSCVQVCLILWTLVYNNSYHNRSSCPKVLSIYEGNELQTLLSL